MITKPRPHVPDSAVAACLAEFRLIVDDCGSDTSRMTDTQRARFYGGRAILSALAGSLGIVGPAWLDELRAVAADLYRPDDPARPSVHELAKIGVR